MRRLVAIPLAALCGLNCAMLARREGSPPDWLSFMLSGQAAASGLNAYGELTITKGPNLNPPISLLVFAPLSQLDWSLCLSVWRVCSMLLLVVALSLLARSEGIRLPPLALLWALSMAGTWTVLEQGQVHTLLLMLTVGAWMLLQRSRLLPAGVLIGLLVAIKPNFLVWPALLFLSGYWLPAGVAIATALLASVIPAILYGPAIYLDWYVVHHVYYTPERIGWPVNTSFIGLATRYDLPALGYVAAFLLLASLAVWAVKCRPDLRSVSSAALVASLLASPIAWVSYTVLLLPLFVRLRWSPLLVAAAVLLAVPSWLVWSVPTLGLYYNLALLPLLSIAVRVSRLTAPASEAPVSTASRP